jgi:predicted alpha-1,2-mannosidase
VIIGILYVFAITGALRLEGCQSVKWKLRVLSLGPLVAVALAAAALLPATQANAATIPRPAVSPVATTTQGAAKGESTVAKAKVKPPGAHATTCGATTTGSVTDCASVPKGVHMPAGSTDKAAITASQESDLADLVDTRTWTSGGGNTFPGADVPFGMVQWSPDTMPGYNDGGGYQYGDDELWGYSLTHLSGPGCAAAGDVPILPMTGALPSGTPSKYTTSFTNTNEVAEAGYYSAQSNQPNTITSQFTETPHSAMGQFTFPSTTQADFLVKLDASQNGDSATSATIVGDDELQGSVTTGNFCGSGQQYTLYFDIVFSQPFTASQIAPESSGGDPDSVFLTFNTTSTQTIDAKVGISYVSTANAQLNWKTENPGWNFSSVMSSAQATWSNLLGEIQVSGGSTAQTQEFYSLLYKDFLQPNIVSDVNGQFMGPDDQVHTLASGQHNQYGIFSGWDIYHSLAQLQAMLDPTAAGDMAQSQLNYYSEAGDLQQWGYLNQDDYVMVGDPADSIISDYYAFGATNFNQSQALTDMVNQATTVNDVRPGEALEQQYGYLPEDGSYGCCNAHGYVSSLLEYDTADFALAQYAAAQGDTSEATTLENRANNWVNVFDDATGLLTPRYQNGSFEANVGPTDGDPYVEGDAEEYLWDVPNDYAGVFSLLGGDSTVVPELRQYLSQPNGYGMYPQISNEFDLGEQYALDYAGDPAGTQEVVNDIRNNVYLPGPAGLANNDDLGAESSQFIWEMLGMYPENPGSGNLVFASPGFPSATITLPSGNTITINAPGASPTTYYVDSLQLNGSSYNDLYVPFSTLAKGATLNWTLGTSPTSWGSAAADAPPSYGPVFPVTAALPSGPLEVQPGKTATTTMTVSSSGAAESVKWTAAAPAGVTMSPSSGSVSVPADGSSKVSLTVTAGSTDADYTIPISFTMSSGTVLPVQLNVVVDKPGDLSPFYNLTGISSDSDASAGNFDGDGDSYSEQALAADGITAGGTFSSGGLTYTWPAAAAGTPDAISADGQKIPVAASAGATEIGFVGSAVNAGTSPATGTLTVTYTDGSTSTGTLTMTDWTMGGASGSVASGNTVVADMPYRNLGSGYAEVTYLFAATIPVDFSKTVASITLPSTVNNGSIGIFAVTVGTPKIALSSFYNLTGISSDGVASNANYDGDGFSYSEQALAADGITAGGIFASGGLTYTWPGAGAGTPDAVSADGQKIPVYPSPGATEIGFVGSAVNAGTSPATGSVTVTYTDGSTSTGTLMMTDWARAGGRGTVAAGDTVVAAMPYRDEGSATDQTTTYLFSTAIPVNSAKTVASVTLPSAVSNGSIGIFAVAVGTPYDLTSFYNVTAVSSDGAASTGNYGGGGYSEQALAADKITAGGAFTSGGLTYTWPGAPAGTPDAVLADGQTIPLAASPDATEIGFVGSAVDAGTSPATGTVTVTYTDGSTSTGTLTMTDWTMAGGAGTVATGDTVVATMPYRDQGSTTDQTTTYLFSTTIPVNSAKTVASITLPATVNNGSIGIFAVVVGSPSVALSPFYNLTGVGSDGAASAANYDGDGFSYSEQALAADGITAGGTFASGALIYTWPGAPAGTPDAVSADGQKIPLAARAGATEIGFVGSAVNAGTSPATGTVTVTYTDGSTSTGTLTMTDWTLGGGGGTVAAGDTVVAKIPYRDAGSGEQEISTYLFSTTIAVNSAKTVASITLPSTVSNGSIGIFTVAVGTPYDLSSFYNVTAVSSDGIASNANYGGEGYSYSEQALAADKITAGGAFTSGGLTYTWPGAPAGTPDAVLAEGQTIPLAAPPDATEIGFVGSAIDAGTSPATGTVTVTYSDGSTSTGTLTMTDWTLGGGSGSVAAGDTVVATMPYRDQGTVTDQTTTYLFSTTITVNRAKTVASITLPSTVSNGSIGVFAISASR